MSDFCKVKIEGLDELQVKIKAMAGDEFRKVVTDATKKGAEVIRAQAAANAPYDADSQYDVHLKDHIVVSMSKKTSALGGTVTAKIGPDQVVWYGRLVEFGHNLVRVVGSRRGKGSHKFKLVKNKQIIGTVEPKPFLRPAVDAKKDEATNTVITSLKNWIMGHTNGNS